MIPRRSGDYQMARKPHEIEVNESTSDEDLEFCIAAAKTTSDVNIQRDAARATVEKNRREKEFKIAILNAQEAARVKAQKFQAAQSERTEEAMANTKDVDPRNVMVVHGRDEALRASMFDFLRSLDLKPIEWEQAVEATGSGSPHTFDVVTKAFEMAMAVVILMTGDDLAKLRPDLVSNGNLDENELLPQPRANVLLETGMALALQRDRTVPVEIGNIRPISNISGINLIKLDNSPEKRNALATRLGNAGCPVKKDGKDWLQAGDFETSLAAPVGPQEDENAVPPSEFSDEETNILKALYENGELSEIALASATGLTAGKVDLWLNELLAKNVIRQTGLGMARGENSFSLSPGQMKMLRQVGVIE